MNIKKTIMKIIVEAVIKEIFSDKLSNMIEKIYLFMLFVIEDITYRMIEIINHLPDYFEIIRLLLESIIL